MQATNLYSSLLDQGCKPDKDTGGVIGGCNVVGWLASCSFLQGFVDSQAPQAK